MTELQMLAKYKGIYQFQCEFLERKQLDCLLPELVSLLDLSYDQRTYKKAIEQTKPSIYYVKSKHDPHCLLLIEFSDYYHQLILRFPQTKEEMIRNLFQNVTKEPLQNTLIRQSKMNDLVKRYKLDIEIVDEYDLWTTVFKQKAFWNEYVKLNNVEVSYKEQLIYPELVEPIRFEIAPRKELWIATSDTINQTMLFLQHPSLENPYELGWDDVGHWHPHVLRWEELEKIVYFLTIRYPEHFVVPFLLLLPFTPISQEENERKIARQIKAAWRSLQLFDEEEIESFDRQIPYMPDFIWNYEPEQKKYHVCDSPIEIYSMRHICHDKFPFAAFDDLLQTIDAAQNTTEWQAAVEKWKKLIQEYSMDQDEDWFHRRETADYYHTSQL